MNKCKACGSEDLIYSEEKKCYICLSCGAKFFGAPDENETRFAKTEQKTSDHSVKTAGSNKTKTKSDINCLTQLKYFSFYTVLPKIVCIVAIVISFIIGVVLASLTGGEKGALYWFVCTLVGAILAVVSYFILKIAFSHKLLQIYYLQKLAGEEKTIFDK